MSHNSSEHLTIDHVSSPIGTLLVVVDSEDRLRALGWEDLGDRMARWLDHCYGKDHIKLVQQRACERIRDPLEAYFAGDIAAIDRIHVHVPGTPFQQEVWGALRKIPVGRTETYHGLASKIGRPKAVRAVGVANGANPIGIVVPCHRVIGADGSLTGYGGGLERKRWLLAHEGVEIESVLPMER